MGWYHQALTLAATVHVSVAGDPEMISGIRLIMLSLYAVLAFTSIHALHSRYEQGAPQWLPS